MALGKRYFEYLDHLGQTVTLADYAIENSSVPMIALRHDVDHDIDIALEMAYWEHRQGCRSTYFVLHSAAYWQDPLFIEKCLQIQDFGHEIGLHVNLLAEWWLGVIGDVDTRLDELLKPLRARGVNVTGIAAHGDKSCYVGNFINYWCFSELRPDNPMLKESGLSAEGVPSANARFQVKYPESGELVRQDGESLALWKYSMRDHGLSYHATHLAGDGYFTDSGGRWERSPDPLEENLRSGRYQVLMHPIYWQGAPKLYFFLSTARSGSMWLSRMLNQSTSVEGRHEFALNHRLVNNEWVEEKRTGPGFTKLLKQPEEVAELLVDVRDWRKRERRDYAEVNVYLSECLNFVGRIFPDSKKIFLQRDPLAIVTSLRMRKWYEVPNDDRHQAVPVAGWLFMSPFERICWYVKKTIENLRDECDEVLRLEEISGDLDSFQNFVERHNWAFYPRLAAICHSEVMNKSRVPLIEHNHWSYRERALFNMILGEVREQLGYDGFIPAKKDWFWNKFFGFTSFVRSMFGALPGVGADRRRAAPKVLFGRGVGSLRPNCVGVEFNWTGDRFDVHSVGGRNGYVLLGGGRWGEITRMNGWKVQRKRFYSIKFAYEKVGGEFRVYLLSYGNNGKVLDRRLCGFLRLDTGIEEMEVRPAKGAARIDIAFYVAEESHPASLSIAQFKLTSEHI